MREGMKCLESVWPQGPAALKDIAASVDYGCRSVSPGGAAYDPSASDAYCGWQGYVAKHRTDLSRCSAKPPSFGVRFCPCLSQDTVDTFDCAVGFAAWHDGWSVAKKAWCCDKQGKGCPDTFHA